MVAQVGLEPTSIAAGDFKSPVFTISPLSQYKRMAKMMGLEPTTFCVTGRRSNQLSYIFKN
jgi:hypothetical protein